MLLSNNFPELPQIIHALGLDGFFESVVVSALVGYEKPHPALFEHALHRAGHPARRWLIGDNPHSDGLGGSRAGIPVVLVHGSRCEQADRHCRDLMDILPLLQGEDGL